MNRVLLGLLLAQCSCEAFFAAFVQHPSEVCKNGGTQCMTGYACNVTTQLCEPIPAPTLGSLSPVLASNAGGTLLQISGQDFQPGATVRIADGSPIPATFVSSSQLRVMLPPSPRGFGRVKVVVENPDGKQGSLDDLFAYYASQPFSSQPSHCSSGFQPGDNLLADFNRDGKLDLITANPLTNNVSLLLGDGTGKFTDPTNFAVGLNPADLATGDFNKDNNPDLVVANRGSNTITVLLGDGTGGFAPAREQAVGQEPVAVVSGDLDADGDVDLVVGNFGSGNNSILLGDGLGGFSLSGTKTASGTCGAPNALVLANFMGDGKPDFAQTCRGATQDHLVSFENNGTYSSSGFIASERSSVNSAQVSLAAGDFTADGQLDIVSLGFPTARILVNSGAGVSAWSRIDVTGLNGISPAHVTVGDFDNNGRPDLVFVNSGSNNVSVLLSTGVGTFSSPNNVTVGPRPVAAAVGDLDNDGKLDLVVANQGSSRSTVLLGDGRGAFTSIPPLGSGLSAPQMAAVDDFDGDGIPDLAVANYIGNNVSVLISDGLGGLAQPKNFVAGTSPIAIAAGDFDKDSRTDLLVANQGVLATDGAVNFLRSNGPASFATPTSTSGLAGALTSLLARDLDGDGKLDLVIGNGSLNSVSVLLGLGTGSFRASILSYGTGNLPVAITAADVDGNGTLDIAVANRAGNNLSLLSGDGLGAFAAAKSVSTGLAPLAVIAGDWNLDQKIDLAVASSLDARINILLGDGAGGFSATAQSPSVGLYPAALVTADA